MGVALLSHQEIKEAAQCSKCKVSYEKRPDAKENICTKCRNKRTQCSKIFGQWPPQPFKALPAEAQAEFWLADSSTGDEIMSDVVKHVTHHRVKTKADMFEGKFLPLTAYAKLGFNTADIKAKCTEVEEHPVLGTTYKVDVHQTSWGEIHSDVEKEIFELRAKRGRCSESDSNRKKKRSRRSSSSSSSSGPSPSKSPSTDDDAPITPEQACGHSCI